MLATFFASAGFSARTISDRKVPASTVADLFQVDGTIFVDARAVPKQFTLLSKHQGHDCKCLTRTRSRQWCPEYFCVFV